MATAAVRLERTGPLLGGPSAPEIVGRASRESTLQGIFGVAGGQVPAVNVEFLFREALALLDAGALGDAETRLHGILRLVADRGPYAVAAHYMLGHIYAQVGNIEAVHAEWKRAAQLDRNNVPLRVNLAGILIKLGRPVGALSVLERAERLAGTRSCHFGDILEFQSFAYLFLDRPEDAERALRRSIDQDPDRTSAYFLLARLFLREGDRTPDRRDEMLHKAATVYDELLARFGEDPAALNNLGAMHAELGDEERAMAYYRRALDIAPEDQWPARNLALALVRLGRFGEATEVLAPLAERLPTDAFLAELLGALYAEVRRLDDAERELLRVVDLNAATANTYVNLGFVRLEQGRYDSAQAYFRKALALAPEDETARANLAEAVARQEAARRGGLPEALYRSAGELDEARFRRELGGVDRTAWTAESFREVVRLAVAVGAVSTAAELAREGVERFADDPQLRETARVLAPPAARTVARRTELEPDKDRAWIAANRDEYRGRWVALHNGDLVAVAETPERLVEELNGREDVFLTRVA